MPRILRNYLISFAVIGMILIIVNWIDHYLTSNEIPPVSEKPEPGIDTIVKYVSRHRFP